MHEIQYKLFIQYAQENEKRYCHMNKYTYRYIDIYMHHIAYTCIYVYMHISLSIYIYIFIYPTAQRSCDPRHRASEKNHQVAK